MSRRALRRMPVNRRCRCRVSTAAARADASSRRRDPTATTSVAATCPLRRPRRRARRPNTAATIHNSTTPAPMPSLPVTSASPPAVRLAAAHRLKTLADICRRLTTPRPTDQLPSRNQSLAIQSTVDSSGFYPLKSGIEIGCTSPPLLDSSPHFSDSGFLKGV